MAAAQFIASQFFASWDSSVFEDNGDAFLEHAMARTWFGKLPTGSRIHRVSIDCGYFDDRRGVLIRLMDDDAMFIGRDCLGVEPWSEEQHAHYCAVRKAIALEEKRERLISRIYDGIPMSNAVPGAKKRKPCHICEQGALLDSKHECRQCGRVGAPKQKAKKQKTGDA